MKIAVVDYLSGIVSKNDMECITGEELKYSDDINAKMGKCIIKFIKSGRLLDISGGTANIGSLAILSEKNIPIKAMHGGLNL